MKRILMIIGILFIPYLLTVYGGSGDQIKVGFSQMEINNPWRIAETNSIFAEAKKRGIELIYTDAKSSIEKQNEDVRYLVDNGVDYIIMAPREYLGLSFAFQAAKERGIPVILIDREAKAIPGIDYLTLISSDFMLQGRRAAQWLVDKMNRQANIVEITGSPGSSVARDRSLGFREVIRDYPQMKIIAYQSGDFNRIEGQRAMERMIQAQGRRITAVFTHNDEMAIGAIQALKAAGMLPGKDVVLVSVDGERDALKAIIAGELGATVECSPFFGPIVFDVIERHLKGENISSKITIEDGFFDLTNAEKYIDKAY